MLVRVDLTSWEIRLIYLIFMLWHYWLYISGICDVGQTHVSPNIDAKNQELLHSHRKGTRASSLLSLSLAYTDITVPLGLGHSAIPSGLSIRPVFLVFLDGESSHAMHRREIPRALKTLHPLLSPQQ